MAPKVGEANMDLLIGGQKGLGQSNSNLIRSRVVMFADLPGFKVNFTFGGCSCLGYEFLSLKLDPPGRPLSASAHRPENVIWA